MFFDFYVGDVLFIKKIMGKINGLKKTFIMLLISLQTNISNYKNY